MKIELTVKYTEGKQVILAKRDAITKWINGFYNVWVDYLKVFEEKEIRTSRSYESYSAAKSLGWIANNICEKIELPDRSIYYKLKMALTMAFDWSVVEVFSNDSFATVIDELVENGGDCDVIKVIASRKDSAVGDSTIVPVCTEVIRSFSMPSPW